MSNAAQETTVLQMAADLSVFADIGTESPSVEKTPEGNIVRFVRHGEPIELILSSAGSSIIERMAESEIKHANFSSLLASDRFGNLRDWVSKQRAYLDRELNAVGSLINVRGLLNGGVTLSDIGAVDDLLASGQKSDSTRVLLIDGPAGIGKTQFIIGLCSKRIEEYSKERHPPILHVQSRGRTLSYLYDLIAFSLQRLRLEVTFDQIPILAKYGLINLAIDGFDELADPDGYDLAWSQVSDLVALLRGNGALILAGRETFIGRDRVISDIASVREGQDDINVLTLQPPAKGEALTWLRGEGWETAELDAIEQYLEPTSLALRPFFLKTLSQSEIAESLTKHRQPAFSQFSWKRWLSEKLANSVM